MPRWVEHVLAVALGYFWLPCPSCGRPFSGREIHRKALHFDSLMDLGGLGSLICPLCRDAGVGCRSHAEKSYYHEGCEFAAWNGDGRALIERRSGSQEGTSE